MLTHHINSLVLPPLSNGVFLSLYYLSHSIIYLFLSNEFSLSSFSLLPHLVTILFLISVLCLSLFSDRAPQILDLDSNLEWNLNSSPKIFCSATGNPLPSHDSIELRKLDSTVLKVECLACNTSAKITHR